MRGFNTVLLLSALFTGSCTPPNTTHLGDSSKAETTNNKTMNTHLTPNHLVQDIVRHPAFTGFGNLLLPRDNNAAYYNTAIKNIASLMPYHNAVDPDEVVKAVNHLIDDANVGRSIFYSFYTDEQKKKDSTKNNTGLFFFRGDPDAPFAIICPGGGFSYVGSLHEGFPLASEISTKKLNAFVIRYRIGSEQLATEDLANAIRYIFENASSLKVNTKNYSLWGASAGARMVGNIALGSAMANGSNSLPKPATVVIAYTGQSTYSRNFPSTFITVAANDGIVNASVVDQRVENLRNAGTEVEYKRYKTAGHGFGTGKGTDAQGWMDDAIRFWKKQIAS